MKKTLCITISPPSSDISFPHLAANLGVAYVVYIPRGNSGPDNTEDWVVIGP